MIRGVNLLALLVLVTAAVLTGIGKLEPESFMLLVTGLAIPARADGYQSVGTGPQDVRVTNRGAAEAVPTEDAGYSLVEVMVAAFFAVLIVLVLVRLL